MCQNGSGNETMRLDDVIVVGLLSVRKLYENRLPYGSASCY